MKFIIFTLLFSYSFLVKAKPIINLNYDEYIQTGRTFQIDASSSFDDANIGYNFYWRLLSKPEGSQVQFTRNERGIISLESDRSGIYTVELQVVNNSNESATEYISLYAEKSVGQVIHGPETFSVDILCFLSFKLFGCNEQTTFFSITDTSVDYSINISSSGIDRGLVRLNGDQVINYVENTGGNDQFSEIINAQNDNTLTFSMIANSINGEYTYSIQENIELPDTNNAPTAQGQSLLAPANSEVIQQLSATDPDGHQVFYRVIDEPKAGSYSLSATGELSYTASGVEGFEDRILVSAYDLATPSKQVVIEVKFLQTLNARPVILAENMVTNTETVSQNIIISDDQNQNLTKVVSILPQNGTLDFDTNIDSLTYTPNDGFTGTDSFEILVRDDGPFNLETRKTIEVEVLSNTAPVLVSEINYEVQQGSTLLLLNEVFDPNSGQIIEAFPTSFPSNGTLVQTGPFSSTYTPNIGFSGFDSYQVFVRDNGNPSLGNLYTISINVIATGNQPPAFNGFIDRIARGAGLPISVEFFLSETPIDPDGNIEKIEWNYGDGNTRIFENGNPGVQDNNYHRHLYTSAGNYFVQVTIFDNEGATKVVSNNIEVTDESLPVAKIVPSVITGSAPLTVNFDGAGSSHTGDTPTENLRYFWGFPDRFEFGQNLTQVSETFTAPGEYTVFLDLQDDSGFRRKFQEVRIYVDQPIGYLPPQINASHTSLKGQAPLTVNFDASQSVDGLGNSQGLTYNWDLGDFNSVTPSLSGSNIAHTFNQPGTYSVELAVNDSNGNSSSALFQVYVESPSKQGFKPLVFESLGNRSIRSTIYPFVNNFDLFTDTILVDWGDGNKGVYQGSSFEHQYFSDGTYDIKIEIQTSNGNIIIGEQAVIIDPQISIPNFVNITTSTIAGVVPYTHQLEIADVLPSDYNIVWILGDGETLEGSSSNLSMVSYTQDAPGVFNHGPILTSQSGFSSFSVIVGSASENEIPILNYNLDSCVGRVPFQVSFDTNLSFSSSGFRNFRWNLSNQENFVEIYGGNQSFGFNNGGRFYQALYGATFSNDFQNKGFEIFAYDQDPPIGNQPPQLSYQYFFFDPLRPTLMDIDFNSSFDLDSEIACFRVDIDGVGSFMSRNGYEKYEFPQEGTFLTTITAFDEWGAEASDSFFLTVGQDSKIVGDVKRHTVVKGRKLEDKKRSDEQKRIRAEKRRKKIIQKINRGRTL